VWSATTASRSREKFGDHQAVFGGQANELDLGAC
jgi:hypothetical protein